MGPKERSESMSKPSILLVQDEDINAGDMQMTLEGMGYDVVLVAASGEDAVRNAQELRPDLVLMDVVLRGAMDGIEAADSIRSSFNIPVIYLTAYADDKMLERAKITEPFGYLIKPINYTELQANIEVALFKARMEKELRESKEWLSVTLKSIGDSVIVTDQAGLVTFMNPAAMSLTGWPEQEAAGKPLNVIFNIVTPDSNLLGQDLIQRLATNGEAADLSARCNVLATKDGGIVPIDTQAALVLDEKGEAIGIVLVFREITRRKMAEERLGHLSAFLEQSSIGIVVADLDGNILFVNQAFALMHGYKPGELAGQSLRIFHNDEQIPEVEAAIRFGLEHGEFHGELWHQRRDGTVFPVMMHNSVLRDNQGNPIALIGTLRDITDRKQTERQLQESHELLEAYSSFLEAKVRERTMDLEKSQRELKRYSESLEKTNEALKIIIQGIEEQKKEVEKKIGHNLNLTVKPIIEQLKSHDLPETAGFLLTSLEFNLDNMFSSFGTTLIRDGHGLTPREVRICDMVRSGLSSKQMAKILGISGQTVLVHRKNIRRKLGLAKSRQNLASFLKANL
jgi:PAS domain S-box-containing protein